MLLCPNGTNTTPPHFRLDQADRKLIAESLDISVENSYFFEWALVDRWQYPVALTIYDAKPEEASLQGLRGCLKAWKH